MNRRQFLAVSGGLLASFARADAAATNPPNIVLVLIDDLGYKDLGCYGGDEFETPRIDQLASESLRFTQAYANCPVCSPSRAALMTGKNPARTGFTGHITAIGRHRHPEKSRIIPPKDNMYLPHAEQSIAELLKPKGYVSSSIGKWHLGDEGFWPKDQGFDENVGGWTHGSPPTYYYPYKKPKKEWNSGIPTLADGEEGAYLTDRLCSEAVDFITRQRAKPFFLYLTLYAVHTPLEAPRGMAKKYKEKFAGRETGIQPSYAAMVENMDRNIGRILDTLKEQGLEENTIVIFTSDNGGLEDSADQDPLREGKGTLYEGGIRVPLMVKWPGTTTPGETTQLAMGTDLLPTIAVMTGTVPAAPDALDGYDLTPLLREGKAVDRKPQIWYYPHFHAKSMRPGAAIREGRYKLIEFYDPVGIELYDLETDLSETTNLAKKEPEKAAALLKDLHTYLDDVLEVRHTLNPAYKG
jgi:arylsulfatase A